MRFESSVPANIAAWHFNMGSRIYYDGTYAWGTRSRYGYAEPIMAEGIVRMRIDLPVAVVALLLGFVVAPLSAMVLPLVLVLTGAVVSWQRPDGKVGLWLLRLGGALALLTAVAAYGVNGHVTSHTRRL